MLPKYIKKSSDLVTKHSDTKKGFLAQALKKSEISGGVVKRAKQLYDAIKNIKTVDGVLKLTNFRNELLAAAGFSQKAIKHLSAKEINEVILIVFHKILKNNRKFFIDEIVYRYLITKGDALGGSMRNIIGSLAGEKFSQSLLIILRKKRHRPKITLNKSGKTQTINWNHRLIIFDHKPKLIGKNIDLIMVDTKGLKQLTKDVFNDSGRYLACGELKGGIDPAGADEHWKTANSALGRIETCFKKEKNQPKLFFIGAAIELSMAEEIFEQLQSDKLDYAANFNHAKQVDDLVRWLISL